LNAAPALHRLSGAPAAARWLQQHISGSLRSDSRQVRAGDGFLAWPGAATDARRYVGQVLAAGAGACLVEAEGAEAWDFKDARVATYVGLKRDAAPIAAAYFGQPSERLAVLAVTGTNGKTSTAWWLAQAMRQLGRRCAVVGTLGIGEPGALVFNGLTTPDPVLFQQQLSRLADDGFVACAVEASSIGLAEHRLDATRVHTAIFTNFTQDHLDYHGSMAAYWAAKAQLFDWPGLQAAVVNVDDVHGAGLAAGLAGKGLDVWTVSCNGTARLAARDIRYGLDALSFEVCEGQTVCRVRAPVVGEYNVANLLGVIAALRSLGLPLQSIADSCVSLSPVPGRMETLSGEGRPLVVIDYAHTPDALAKVLQALQPLAHSRGGRICCVFGCGGDRDAGKRPLMAAAAAAGAQQLVLTSDNPRSEDPGTIIAAIAAGLPVAASAQIEPDRALAIALAVRQAAPHDVVLLAGKGHETYQDIGGIQSPFSDHSHAEVALAAYTPAGRNAQPTGVRA
jgi:UDP-N-acetylmuramoyl-L-alanyl-D-glutamate--2,6-diaminopimelate ligase